MNKNSIYYEVTLMQNSQFFERVFENVTSTEKAIQKAQAFSKEMNTPIYKVKKYEVIETVIVFNMPF